MPMEIIDKHCVKVLELNNEGEIINQGSGVIIKFNDKQYVLTSHHCVEGLDKDKIIIKNQKQYDSDFEDIEVIDIIDFSEDDDWILLELKQNEIFNSSTDTKLTKNIPPNTKVNFTGYQGINSNEFRLWEAKVLNVSDKKFKITIIGDTFQQAGEDGKTYAKGLSGSGVYISKNGTPLLIGILSSVKTEQAINDDIDCCHVSCIENRVQNKFEELDNIKTLKEWERKIEENNAESNISEWITHNNEWFKNISRKNNVLINHEDQANDATNRNIKKYLSVKQTIDDFEEQFPETFLKFRQVIKRFNDKVKDDYSREVINANEAKDIKIELTKELKEEISYILPENISLRLDLTDFQIIEWLMNCSLNFYKND